MKRQSLLVVLLVAAAIVSTPAALRAQIPTAPPTPTPDPQVYSDEAMTFRAPDIFRRVASRTIPLDQLSEDQPIPLAIWVRPDKDNPRTLALAAEANTSDLDGWDGTYEQQIRQNLQSVNFRNKQHFSLKNGMPAMFMTMTSGEGFDVKKSYIVLWADSQRGMVLQLTTRLDDITEAQARDWLSDVSAVRYPTGR